MDNRINNKKNSREISYLTDSRNHLIQKKYSFVIELLDLFFLRNATGSIIYHTHANLIYLWKNTSGIMELDNKFHEVTAVINHYASYFFQNHCKDGCISILYQDERYLRKEFDMTLFIDYLKTVSTKGEELLSNYIVDYIPVPMDHDLLHFIEKASRFSKDYLRLIAFNSDIEKNFKKLPDQVLSGHLSQNFRKIVSTLDTVLKDLNIYAEDKLTRFELNLRNDVIDRSLLSSTTVLLLFFLPFEAVFAALVAQRSGNGFKNYLIKPYITPTIIKKMKQWEKSKLSLQDRSAIKEKKPHGVIVLETQVKNLSRTVNRLEIVKIILYSIWSINLLSDLPYSILHETRVDPQNLYLLFFFPIKLIMFVAYLNYIKQTLFQYYTNYNLENDIEKARKVLNDATESVRSEEVKVYKRETIADTCFYLSIQEKLPLSVNQIARIVKKALKNNFCTIEYIDTTNDKDIINFEIKITSFPDKDQLSDAIFYSFERMKSIMLLSQQMKELGKSIGAYVAIIPTQLLGKAVDEIILAFLFDIRAKFWLNILKTHALFKDVSIVQNEHRLIMQTSFFDQSTFKQMLSQLEKIYHEQMRQPPPKAFYPGFFPKLEVKKNENNNDHLPKNKKIKTRKEVYTVIQLIPDKKIKQNQSLSSPAKSLEVNNLEELDSLPPKITRSPFWSKTTNRYLKFSLTLKHFEGNQEAFTYCSKQADKAKMGYNPNKKKKKPGLILINDESLHAKDCITGKDFIVKGKMKVKSKKNGIGKIRMYAKMAKWLIFKGTPDERVIEGYDIRALNMKHK